MGFFDRFTAKKPTPSTAAPAPVAAPTLSSPSAAPFEAPTGGGTGASTKARLATARERLEARDVAGALAIYEEILASSGDRADVLVTISGDLGAHGFVAEIIELVAPRYDAERHGPATGINLIQAYLAVRNADAAQHILDILFGLKRPELEDRLHGFSNAIAELLHQPEQTSPDAGTAQAAAKVGLITLSKPVWFYGLEPLADEILPQKSGKLRRVAFGQLALPGTTDVAAAIAAPENELTRLSRALPAWLAETFAFSDGYAASAAVGIITPPEGTTRHMVFATEWTTENLRQLVDSNQGGLDYIVTGALTAVRGDYEVVLRLYEVKTFRERKKFSVRWTPATADAVLGQLHLDLRRFMEWTALPTGMTYEPPTSPTAWLATLGASVAHFVADKGIVPADQLGASATDVAQAGEYAVTSEAAALAYLTLEARAQRLGTPIEASPALFDSPLVRSAAELAG